MVKRLIQFSLIFFFHLSIDATELIGKKIPEFELKCILNDQRITQNDLPEEPFVLHFWSSWCNCCHKDLRNLEEIAMHFPIVSITVADDDLAMQEWLSTNDSPFLHVLDDHDSKVTIDFHIPFTPYTLLVNGDGTIVKENPGLINNVNEFLYQ